MNLPLVKSSFNLSFRIWAFNAFLGSILLTLITNETETENPLSFIAALLASLYYGFPLVLLVGFCSYAVANRNFSKPLKITLIIIAGITGTLIMFFLFFLQYKLYIGSLGEIMLLSFAVYSISIIASILLFTRNKFNSSVESD